MSDVPARDAPWWSPGRRPGSSVDPGLQAERTAMAWQRTALGVGAIGALLLRTAGRSWTAVPGAVGMVVALVLIAASEHRYVRTIRKVEAGRPAHGTTMVRLLTGVTVLLAVSALLVALDVD